MRQLRQESVWKIIKRLELLNIIIVWLLKVSTTIPLSIPKCEVGGKVNC